MDGRRRFDRLLGILLLLRGDRVIPAAEIARRFGVSRRTVHRDMDALSALGIPVYAERGRGGGFRLLPGYFLPPIMFAEEEAISLMLGVILLGSLHAAPYAGALDTAERKLLAAMPERLRATLVSARQIIGFERVPADVFHPEPQNPGAAASGAAGQEATLSIFLRALLDRRRVTLEYRSPYRGVADAVTVSPRGLFWDRDRWYLVAARESDPDAPGLWRADRVIAIAPAAAMEEMPPAFDVRALLGRQWLAAAMAEWAHETPVRIRMTRQQAERLRRDWLYQHAQYEPVADGAVIVNIGENAPEYALELVRWLGPGAELLEPAAWREQLRSHLAAMLSDHRDLGDTSDVPDPRVP